MRRLRAIRPTWRAAGLGLGAIGLGVTGSATGADILVWFAITIACFLVAVGAWIAWEISLDLRVRLYRALRPTQLQVGRSAVTEVGWPRHQSPRPLTTLTDTSPLGEHTSPSTEVLPRRRGITTLGPALVHRRDPFGLFRWRTEGRPSDRLTVWPRTDAVEAQVFHRLAAMALGSHGAATPDLDDLTLREYQHGDPLSRVYWKRRTPEGTLLVRHDEPARNPAIDLVLVPGDPARTDAAVDILASAADALCTPERQVRLLTGSRVVPGDRADLLTALALAESGRPAIPPEFPAEVVIIAPAEVTAQVAEQIISWIAASEVQADSVFIFPAPADHDLAEELLGAFTVVSP